MTDITRDEIRDAGQAAIALVTAAYGGAEPDVYHVLLEGLDTFDVLAGTVALSVAMLRFAESKSPGFGDRWLSIAGQAVGGMES